MFNEMIYWLALNDNRGVISHTLLDIIVAKFGSLQKLWNLTKQEIMDIGINNTDSDKLINFINNAILYKYDEIIQYVKKNNIKIIKYIDDEYPLILKTSGTAIHDPPFVLFRKGLKLDFVKSVAIVGTREASDYAKEKARLFSKILANQKYWIISGMAFGIDYQAHYGALEVMGGRTIAVLPWMDPITPKSHIELSKRIIENGCLLSDRVFRPQSRKLGWKIRWPFIERNRITSGLSNFIIPIETGKTGGTMRQVELARAQNKDVYTIYPDPKSSKTIVDGFNELISKGAKPINDVSDIDLRKYDKHYDEIKRSSRKYDDTSLRLIYGYNEEDAINRFFSTSKLKINKENLNVVSLENNKKSETFEFKYFLLHIPDLKFRPPCRRCGSENVISRGHVWFCKTCGRYFMKKS